MRDLVEMPGFIRLFDLDDVDDDYPLFDLRIRAAYRGRGLGKCAVQWLMKYLFERYPQLDRIVGTTRVDNSSMRKTFRFCGYVKEGHFRKDWSTSNGDCFDTVNTESSAKIGFLALRHQFPGMMSLKASRTDATKSTRF